MLGSGPTFELAGLTIGLREGLIGLIVLIGLYMAFEVFRARRARDAEATAPAIVQPVSEPRSISLTDEVAAVDDLPSPKLSKRHEERWDKPPENMAANVLQQGMAQDLALLREELDALRGELAALRKDMQHEMAVMKASQTVSPIYGDAMQMAMSGYDANLISERCGIARAEAELVLALAKSRNE